MADYWKSNPRHFCEFCKCWIADNKPSKDFHEKGKRHKENVEKKINDLRKKGVKDAQAKKDMSDYLKQMEKAAQKAFKKDLEKNPSLAAQYGVNIDTKDAPKESNPQHTASIPKKKPGKAMKGTGVHVRQVESTVSYGPSPANEGIPTVSQTVTSAQEYTNDPLSSWSEAKSDEGYTYYWNYVTGETTWVKPEGFVSTNESVPESRQDSSDTAKITKSDPITEDTGDQNVAGAVLPDNVEHPQENSPQDSEQVSNSPARASDDVQPPEKIPLPSENMDVLIKAKEVNSAQTSQLKAGEKRLSDPHRNRSAYGTWAAVPAPVKHSPVDLQLPPDENAKQFEERKVVVPTESKIKFREKKVDTLGAEFVAFKKRKMNQHNMKGRSLRAKEES